MKKFVFLMCMCCLMVLASCDLFKKDNKSKEPKAMTETVEQVFAADNQDMTETCKSDTGTTYVWFETQITMMNFLDAENASPEVMSVCNVFQSITAVDSTGADTYVYLYNHDAYGSKKTEIHDFWMEDNQMKKDDILLSFENAYEKVMASNFPKPHSRNCTLRKQVGSQDCNPQYIFGNVDAQLYVDARTGAVTDENPAFTKPDKK